jgi:hypothetical protein
VDEMVILGRSDDQRFEQRVLGHYDAPAFIRRARRVQETLEHLLAKCRQQRDGWLTIPRIHLGLLKGLSGDWQRLRSLLCEDQIVILQVLESELSPQLRGRVEPTSSRRILKRALLALRESLETFNRRWADFLGRVDLAPVNEARDGYNRYYLLEKECAMRSARLARQGFKRLAPFTFDELMRILPDLPIPKHLN